jgi:hypothetical protein
MRLPVPVLPGVEPPPVPVVPVPVPVPPGVLEPLPPGS